MRFFIPKASQNWIIGDKLIMTKEDGSKKLEDFDIRAEEVDNIPIYIYVMHAKKANVPKEEHDAIRNKHQEQRKGQQEYMGTCSTVTSKYIIHTYVHMLLYLKKGTLSRKIKKSIF